MREPPRMLGSHFESAARHPSKEKGGVSPMTQKRTQSCRIVRGGATFEGKQGLAYATGVFAETTGSRSLSMHVLTIPPGGRAKAHLHAHHESAVYIVSGEVEAWYGEGLGERTMLHAGDFVYIPPDVPHLPVNRSKTTPAACVIARTDANEQESVVLLPDLDRLIS